MMRYWNEIIMFDKIQQQDIFNIIYLEPKRAQPGLTWLRLGGFLLREDNGSFFSFQLHLVDLEE